MVSMRLKVGLVTVLSCFALLLGLLGSTGIASAHTAQTAQSVQVAQSQTTSVSHTEQYCRLVPVRVVRFWYDYFGFLHESIRYRFIVVCHPYFWYGGNGYDGYGF
jgi:hypothetical protein